MLIDMMCLLLASLRRRPDCRFFPLGPLLLTQLISDRFSATFTPLKIIFVFDRVTTLRYQNNYSALGFTLWIVSMNLQRLSPGRLATLLIRNQFPEN
jgi:hypothetical protein